MKSQLRKSYRALGGALTISALFIWVNIVFAYDQQNTHPALTDEAVDFYNLNFTENQLTEEDKSMLIKGVTEEDTPVRWLNHFYDPVYNTGWIGYTSAKDWAYNSDLQIAFYTAANYGGFANLLGEDLHPQDYSYQRALYDYATGDRKRAMLAMGHVMHLLEDSNVPEHTRGDTHLPWHGTESPYEKEMAKWGPVNVNVVENLNKTKEKPILLPNLNEYFAKIAGYSNGYFFSQDTINTSKYKNPNLRRLGKEIIDGEEKLFSIWVDKNGEIFKTALLNVSVTRNIFSINSVTLIDPDIGTLILDDYWSRLSKDFVIHGAGALKLFLDQAEQVRQAYQDKYKIAGNQNIGPIERFFAFLGWEPTQTEKPPFDTAYIDSIITQPTTQAAELPNRSNQPLVAGESDTNSDYNDGTNDGGQIVNGGNGDNSNFNDGLPSLNDDSVRSNGGPVVQTSFPNLGVGGGVAESQNDKPEMQNLEPTPIITPEPVINYIPTTISDLAVDTTSFFGDIKLTWSAPFDGDSPRASLSYDLRYATKSFDTITDWDAAMPISSTSLFIVSLSNIPAIVASPGQPESVLFSILDYDQTYYFAIKTTDSENWSNISNVARYDIKRAVSDWQDNLEGPASPSISWQFELPTLFNIAQPGISKDGDIYFGASNYWTSYFYSLNKDGLENWRFSGLNSSPSTPAVLDDGAVYFGQFDPGSNVTGLSRNGIKRWEFGVGDRVNGVSVDEDGDVYFSSENEWVSSLDSKGHKKWQFLNDFTFNFVPLVIKQDKYKDDIFIAANNAGQPEFYRINRDDGSIIWQKRNNDRFIYSVFEPVYDVNTDTLYAPTTNFGQILSVNPSNGEINKNIFDYGSWPTTMVTIVDDLMVLGVSLEGFGPTSGSAVYALDVADPSVIKWRFPLESYPVGRILKDRNNNLYFVTRLGKIYSIDSAGIERWSLDPGAIIDQYPVLGERSVYIVVGNKLIKIGD